MIQGAIDAASPGDTVLVEAGYYVENLDFLGKSIVLRSESGPETTTIDGRNADDSVIKIMNGEDTRTIVEGFTITGGRGYANPKSGGGIFMLESSCTIRNNVFVANETKGPSAPTENGWGAGVYCGENQGYVLIEANVFKRNSAGRNGGGIGIRGKVSGCVRYNRFIENDCTYGDGGGLWVLTKVGNIDIYDNIFLRNNAGDHGGGAYIASNLFSTTFAFSLERNIFADNTATSRSITPDAGGGCWIEGMNGPITSNTFARNTSVSNSPADGSGLTISEKCIVSVELNLFALNKPGAALICEPTVVPTLRHNLFWGNLPTDVVGEPCSDQVLTDNIFEDPQFCDSLSTENFSLAASSPALTYPAGPIGAVTEAGCPGTAVAAVTWSQVKAMFSGSTLKLVPIAKPATTGRPPILIVR